MEYVYAALLLHKAGKPIKEENVTQVLGAAGINVDAIRVKALVASLSEVNIDEVIKTPPAFAPVAQVPTTVPASSPKAKAEEEKEEKKEEKEEAAMEGLGALFG